MNTEQVKGKLKEIVGEAQEHIGRFFGSDSQEAKGHNLEMQGKAEKAVGDLKEAREERVQDEANVRPVGDPLTPNSHTNFDEQTHDMPLQDPDGALQPGFDSRINTTVNPLREGIDPVNNTKIERLDSVDGR